MDNAEGGPEYVSRTYQTFLKEFIKIYKENEILWDQNHPQYKNRSAREVAFNLLISKSTEYYPDANIDFVKTKIDNIRGAFRRQYKKVQESKKKAKTGEEIYVPTLWYYNLLLFTVGEEIDEELEESKDYSKLVSLWSKEYTVVLIELLKKHPVLYTNEGFTKGSKTKRFKAYRDIASALSAEVDRHFEVHEIKSKISTLKQQFRRECRERKNNMRRYSKLWCYDLLMFLKDSCAVKEHETKKEDESDNSDECTENLWINYELDSDTDRKDEQIFQGGHQDDIFDTIGKHVAIKLRDMNDDQKIYAENLINEVAYNGLTENLTVESKISFTGD